MTALIAGLLVFIGVHLLPTQPEWRRLLRERLGEGPYKGLFSLVAILGLGLVVWGYRRAPFIAVWEPPLWTRHLALLLMLVAIVLVVAAYVPGTIKARLRHPFLAGVKTWAVAHLFANGDLASILLFGSFLLYAIVDRLSVKHREAVGLLSVPTNGALRNDILAAVVACAVYAAIVLWLHPLLGAPVLP